MKREYQIMQEVLGSGKILYFPQVKVEECWRFIPKMELKSTRTQPHRKYSCYNVHESHLTIDDFEKNQVYIDSLAVAKTSFIKVNLKENE